jgi:hypothetical protein
MAQTTEDSTTITIPLKLTTDEAQDFAVLRPRLVADRLVRFSWRSCGDTDVTVARWGVVLKRIADQLAASGYPAVHHHGGPAQ